MKDIKKVLGFGALFIGSSILFIGSLVVISIDNYEFISNVAGLTAIGVGIIILFSVVMLFNEIKEETKEIQRDSIEVKKD